MKVYKLVHKNYNGEVVFGLPFPYNESLSEKKIISLFSDMKPWTHVIPYYMKSKFAFVSSDALLTFIMYLANFTSKEYEDFLDKFEVESFDLNTWSSGLSKFLCTYFDDEIEEGSIENVNIEDLRNWAFKVIYQDPVPEYDIDFCKDSFYKKVKTFYNV